MKKIELSVIIVNYNSHKIIPTCLNSILDNVKNIDYEIIIVDNNSKDDSCKLIEEKFKECILIKNYNNIGFARAVNQGFRMAQGEFLLILNPDVRVLNSSIIKAIKFLKNNPTVGILLPKLLNSNGTLQYSCRKFYDFKTIIFKRFPLAKFNPINHIISSHLMIDEDHDKPLEVDWGLGACMFIRRAALKGNKVFDERFFLYFEDVDLCFRMKRKGFKIIYLPEAVMIHAHMRQSAKGLINRAKWEHFISLLKFLLKHKRLRPI